MGLLGNCASSFSHKVFICCCGGFLNPNGEGSHEYYEILGLEKGATQAQVKSAWKKKSLAYHPDKLAQRGKTMTQEDHDMIQKINEAYECLHDPERRKLYDELGSEGLRIVEHPESMMHNPEDLARLFARADTGARLNVFLFVAVLVGWFMLWPILFSLKADGDLDASWAVVWFPLWVVYALLLLVVTADVLRGKSTMPEELDEEEKAMWTDPSPLHERVGYLVFNVSWVLWNVLLVMRLDDDIEWSYVEVMVPFFLCEVYNVVTNGIRGVAAIEVPEDLAALDSEALKFEVQSKIEEALFIRARAREAAFWYAVRALQVLTICLKVDGEVDAGWWVVLCPLWVYIGTLTCSCCFGTVTTQKLQRMRHLKEPADVENDMHSMEDKLLEEKIQMSKSQTSYYCCTCVTWIVFVVLLAVRLSPSLANFSIFWFFFPLFLCSCCVVCGTCCCLACSGEYEEEAEEGESNLDNPMDAGLLQHQMGSTPGVTPANGAPAAQPPTDVTLPAPAPAATSETAPAPTPAPEPAPAPEPSEVAGDAVDLGDID